MFVIGSFLIDKTFTDAVKLQTLKQFFKMFTISNYCQDRPFVLRQIQSPAVLNFVFVTIMTNSDTEK